MSCFVVAVLDSSSGSHESIASRLSTLGTSLPTPASSGDHWSDPQARVHAAWWDGGGDAAEPQPARGVRCTAGRPITLPDGTREGMFSELELDPSGRGVLRQDPFGLHGLFAGRCGVIQIFANRPDLVAAAVSELGGAPVRKDPTFAAWLALAGFPAGSRTGYEGVTSIGGFTAVSIDPVEGARLVAAGAPPWVERLDGPSGDLVDGASRHLVALVEAVFEQCPGPFRAELTGGKDSRLVMALLKSAGRLDDVEFFTRGSESIPDAVAAKVLADGEGARHVMKKWRSDGDPRSTLLRHVRRSRGELNCRDMSAPTPFDGVTFSGFAGEALRTNWPTYAGIQDAEQAADAFCSMPFGVAQLLHTDVAVDALAEGLRAFEQPRESARPADLFDAFYIGHRLRRWVSSRPERFADNVFALYSNYATRVAFSLPWTERVAGRLHADIIRAAGGVIAEQSYEKEGGSETWSTPDPARFVGAARRVRRARPRDYPHRGAAPGEVVPVVMRTTGPESEQLRRRSEMLREIVDARPDNPAWEIIDRDRLAATVDALPRLTKRGTVELHGALTAVIWLGDLEPDQLAT